MKIKVDYTFQEDHVPPRCRKPRPRDVKKSMSMTITEVSNLDAPVAMIVTDYEWRKVDTGGIDGVDLIPVDTNYRWFNNTLFKPYIDRHGNSRNMSDYANFNAYPYNITEKERRKQVRDYFKQFLFVDGILHTVTGEPRYVINTFGLGHNHGGTGFFVETFYNSNIGKNNYFNALQREEAIEYFNRTALGRGDTESVGVQKEDKRNIKVLIPEAVKCNPQKEHGEGCSFINSLESMIRVSGSKTEAGLLVMAMGLAEISKTA